LILTLSVSVSATSTKDIVIPSVEITGDDVSDYNDYLYIYDNDNDGYQFKIKTDLSELSEDVEYYIGFKGNPYVFNGLKGNFYKAENQNIYRVEAINKMSFNITSENYHKSDIECRFYYWTKETDYVYIGSKQIYLVSRSLQQIE
jgi:hypothetical protein